jgi:hypothetical protein
MATLAPNQSQIQTVLRSFLLSVLPGGVEVVQGQDNLVSEPAGADFVVMTPLSRDRIETNVDTFADISFTGSITGSLLSITEVQFGVLGTSTMPEVFGTMVNAGTYVTGQVSGTIGGVGVYTVTGTQTSGVQPMAAGQVYFLQPTKIRMQLDVHGPNSSDNAQTISTLFRDQFAVSFFQNSGYDVWPLYADDPKQIPFPNAEMLIEYRWVIDAELQANQVVGGFPQQFANTFNVNLIQVQ